MEGKLVAAVVLLVGYVTSSPLPALEGTGKITLPHIGNRVLIIEFRSFVYLIFQNFDFPHFIFLFVLFK